MRTIGFDTIRDTVAALCGEANRRLSDKALHYYRDAYEKESGLAKSITSCYLENVDIAAAQNLPLCQDTGTALFFIELGCDVAIEGESPLIADAINAGVRKGYVENYLRKSIVEDPLFERRNTGDNTPAIIHLDIVRGDRIAIHLLPKGGGSENMSAAIMLPPSALEQGLVDFVVAQVKKAGANPCPPVIAGIGVGGNFERAALLSKKALLREGPANDDRYARLESRILGELNRLGIGPQGMGGSVSAYDVFIEHAPCHIASLPVALSLSCHIHRHASIVL